MDGKHLRGNKRKGKEAPRVMAMAGHRLPQVLTEQPVEREGKMATAVMLLSEIPLAR